MKARTARVPLLVLAVGHACADLCSGALIALLPFLVLERDYSYAAVGVFGLTVSVAAAVLQPLLGAHGDRRAGFWLMPVGLVVAGLGIGAVGFTESFSVTLLAVVVSSAGISAYHPEGARWARLVSGGRINRDMGVFSLGGSIGYALGPLVVAAALAPLGLRGTLVIPLVPFAAAGLLLIARPSMRGGAAAGAEARSASPPLVSAWRPFVRLLALCCVAGGITTGLFTYVPLYLVQECGTSPGASEVVSSVLLAAAAVGTLLGGIAAQHFGRRVALAVPQLVLAPVVAVMPALGYGAMLPVVVVAGIAMNAYMSITLVLAQEYLPAHMGLATGLTVGLSGGGSGLLVAALGLFADRFGVSAALVAIAALPLLLAALAVSLPRGTAAPPGPVRVPQAEVEE